MKQLNLYLAAPFFNEEQEEFERLVANTLNNNRSVNYVFQPKNLQTKETFGTTAWKKDVYEIDTKMIKKSDVVVAIGNFLEENGEVVLDTGTAFEIGYAQALGKPIALIIFNHVPEKTSLNVMVDMGTDYQFSITKDEIQKALFDFDFNKMTLHRENWKAI